AETAQPEETAQTETTVETAQPEETAQAEATAEIPQPEETAQTEATVEITQTEEPAQTEATSETTQAEEPAQTEATAEIAPSVPEKSTQPAQTAPAKAEKPEKSASSSVPTAYQVVARRYRPQAFGELIGQETVARALSNAIETNRVGHAYLFTGARGVGKTSCARIFAKALNCVDGPTVRPCLTCDSCVAVSTGDDVDVIEIDGASNRGVDEIRQLRQNATIAPSRSLYKIYIIDEVHMLTREAFNALLKTLEEPPARVKFIFCTTEPNKIPITILSRCQRFDFSGIASGSIAERLAQIAAQEGAEAEDGVFEILARRANGSMRDAQSLLEQLLSFAPTYISQDDARGMLGSVDDKKLFDILDATVVGNCARVFEIVADAAAQGVDFGVLVEQTLGVYRDLMVVANGCGARELMYSPVARLAELQEIAAAFGIRRILASLQILDQTAQRMRFSAQSRILAELAFARLCLLDSFQALETLIDRLRAGGLPELGGAPAASSPGSALPSASPEPDGKKKNNALTPPVETPSRLPDAGKRSTPESAAAPSRSVPVVRSAAAPPTPNAPGPSFATPPSRSERPAASPARSVPVPVVRSAAALPTPDAPPLDEEPPYFLAESGAFETEIDVSDVFPTPNRPKIPINPNNSPSSTSAVEPPRSFQAPSLVGRSLPPRPTYRNPNADVAPTAKNCDENNKTAPDSSADAPWLALSSKELAAAWLDATRGLGCILPTQAATFARSRPKRRTFLSFPSRALNAKNATIANAKRKKSARRSPNVSALPRRFAVCSTRRKRTRISSPAPPNGAPPVLTVPIITAIATILTAPAVVPRVRANVAPPHPRRAFAIFIANSRKTKRSSNFANSSKRS
ncbi:MAG: DNA polymerase III subunit gamma/tau, partial [Thermoguttaceae bacterium]|nr:DNA polymerase III subunit gamma/tau [Thermoguttaceae bacterium]